MNRKAVALIVSIFWMLLSVEISTAGASSNFGHSNAGRFAGSLKQSGGFRASSGGHGFHLRLGSRHAHPHHFGQRKHFHHKKGFTPHQGFVHRLIIPRRGLHSGFFFGHRIIGVPSSSVVIWSRPGTITGYTAPPPETTVAGDGALDRPLITIMLRNGHELGLSSEQVQTLESLRDEYQREAIRYDADIRIAEMDLQRLMRTDIVDLALVKAKLQEIEHLKTELRFKRFHAIEQGKALLSPEQQAKLQALLGQSRYPQLPDDRSSPFTEN